MKITNLKLLEILDDKSTVLSAFVGKTIVLATSDLNHHMQYNVIEYNDIDRDELPLCDQYLEMKDHLKSYIEKIAKEISSATLKISLPFHDIRTNEPNIPQSNLVRCSSDNFSRNI